MNNKNDFSRNQFTWPLSKKLLFLIIEDQVSDVFVCKLVWERLFYVKEKSTKFWFSSKKTPLYWAEKFIKAPQIISERPASIHLTRSIPKLYKQCLKNFLNFKGYKINELYPRRTRRATAVNWLIYWSIASEYDINEFDNLPELSHPPLYPLKGHDGDPDIK
tara:strand:- start:541 stop:1026 length:486 start_codon:yes stop_codon:yes gene_type:complete